MAVWCFLLTLKRGQEHLTSFAHNDQLSFRMGYDALLVPAALTGVTGLGYVAYRYLWALRERAYDAGD